MSRGNRDVVVAGAKAKAVSGAGTTRANRNPAPEPTGFYEVEPNDRRDLPTESSPNFLARMREAMSVYLGKRGDPLDRGITVRDLENAGLVTVGDGYLSNPGAYSPISGLGPGVEGAYVIDLAPPPSPTGFVAVAAVSNILVEHDGPNFKQGHGYARTRLYGVTYDGSADLPVFTDATLLTEFIGTVFSYPTDPATTWRLWITWLTKDGIESTIPAGGLNGLSVTTAQNPAKLLAALTGQITESQLFSALGERIDLIDGGAASTHLPYPMVDLLAAQDALNQRIAHDLDTIGSDLLTNAATINTTTGLVTAAGIYVDEGTGTVKISGLEATNSTLSTVDARLSAAETSITLKATKTYVDNLVATAVIDPSQIPVFGDLEARITSAEVDIDGLNAEVALKASNLELAATTARVTTAETNISALAGTITSKVDTGTFDSVTGGLNARLGSAETSLSAIGDVSAITNIVQQSNQRHITDNQDAETLLRNILNTQRETDARTADIALARSDLTAYVNDGIGAEATARLLLTTTVNGNTASLQEQQTSIDGLFAQYTLKLDVGGRISGFGLASSPTASAFAIRADQFYIAPPATGGGGAVDVIPFVVQATDTTIGGVAVPAGVYMDTAFIKNGTINNAKIANLAVDDAKIASLSVAKLVAGSMSVGQYIRSASQHSYAGVMDWDWQIDANGLATFNNAVVRGGLYATYGQIGGNIIDATSIRSGQTAYNNGSGFFLGSDGKFSLGNSGGNRLTFDGDTLLYRGSLDVRSAVSGARLEISDEVIKVFDINGTLRVKIGNLA